MKNSNANFNGNVDNPDKSHNGLSSTRKKALINLLVMPLYLLIFFALIFFQWRVSINWVLALDLKMKVFWFVIGLLLILVAFVLSHYVRRFSKWVYSRKSADDEHKT
jgi:hypothetical protein